jgi:hypothetical protein
MGGAGLREPSFELQPAGASPPGSARANGLGVAGRDLRRRAQANRGGDGSLPSGREISRQFAATSGGVASSSA